MENEIESLAALLRGVGASEEASIVMAKQLLKRADQLAAERSVSRLEALDYLVKVTIAGREGRVHEGGLPGKSA